MHSHNDSNEKNCSPIEDNQSKDAKKQKWEHWKKVLQLLKNKQIKTILNNSGDKIVGYLELGIKEEDLSELNKYLISLKDKFNTKKQGNYNFLIESLSEASTSEDDDYVLISLINYLQENRFTKKVTIKIAINEALNRGVSFFTKKSLSNESAQTYEVSEVEFKQIIEKSIQIESPQAQMISAVAKGDLEHVQQLAAIAPDFSRLTDKQENNLLHLAIKFKQGLIVQFLIEHGVSLIALNKSKQSPITAVLALGDQSITAIVAMQIVAAHRQFGWDYNLTIIKLISQYKFQQLDKSTKKFLFEMLQTQIDIPYISKRIDISLLVYFVRFSQYEMCSILIQKGILALEEIKNRKEAMLYAIEQRNWPLVELMLEYDEEKVITSELYTEAFFDLVISSTYENKAELAELLIARGADINDFSTYGLFTDDLCYPKRCMILHRAIDQDDFKLISLLLARNYVLKPIEKNRKTYSQAGIVHAAFHGKWSIVELIAKFNRPQMNDKDDLGLALNLILMSIASLQEALQTNSNIALPSMDEQIERAKLLLRQGADPNIKFQAESTPSLHLAIDSGDLKLIQLCLSREINLGVLNAERNTAILYAANKGLWNVVELLAASFHQLAEESVHYGVVLDLLWQKKEFDQKIKLTKLLLKDKPSFALHKTEYANVIFHAIDSGDLESVKLLMTYKQYAEAKNVAHKTCAQYALERKQWEILSYLISAQKFSYDICKLEILSVAIQENQTAIVRLILRHSSFSTKELNQLSTQLSEASPRILYLFSIFYRTYFFELKNSISNKKSNLLNHFAVVENMILFNRCLPYLFQGLTQKDSTLQVLDYDVFLYILPFIIHNFPDTHSSPLKAIEKRLFYIQLRCLIAEYDAGYCTLATQGFFSHYRHSNLALPKLVVDLARLMKNKASIEDIANCIKKAYESGGVDENLNLLLSKYRLAYSSDHCEIDDSVQLRNKC